MVTRNNQIHSRQTFYESWIASQAIPLRSDGQVHERGVPVADRAIEMTERRVDVARLG